MEPDFKRLLDTMNRAQRRRNAQIRDNERNFSDLEYEPTVEGWQGPRLHFSHLIGEGAIWDGPPEPGRFCHGRKLKPNEACLDCDRTGRDALIPSPPAAEQHRGHEGDGLRGGKG